MPSSAARLAQRGWRRLRRSGAAPVAVDALAAIGLAELAARSGGPELGLSAALLGAAYVTAGGSALTLAVAGLARRLLGGARA